ncbi:MAG: hypothetical protein ACXVYY_01245 [Oryzihumus sp.]
MVYELYLRNPATGLLNRSLPVLPFASRKAADREARKYRRTGVEAQIRTAGRAIESVPA